LVATVQDTRFYRYKVESLKILFPDEGIHYVIDDTLVRGITIERDYENDFFPVIRLDLSLNTELYHKVIKNHLSVKFHLRLQKYEYDSNSVLKFKRDVFNETFIVFLDDNTPFLDKSLYDESQKLTSNVNTPGMTPITVGGNDIAFYLFKEHDMMYSKEIINTVLTSANMTDAIAYLLSALGFMKTLMTPMENRTNYKVCYVIWKVSMGTMKEEP
jgi:hypothetical protein